MKKSSALGFAITLAVAGCAARGPEQPESVPLCGALDALAPPPVAGSCDAGELANYEVALVAVLDDHAKSSLVRVELDDAAQVSTVCVVPGPGYAPTSARRALADQLDALRALPPGPACTAGRRLDLNRYAAKEAVIHDRENQCREQTRVTRETQGPTTIRNATVRGHYGVYDREFERCMEYNADWIVLDAPGSTRRAIFAKPEVPDPPGPPAYDTAHRCERTSRIFEKRAACIEADGWERLEPPPR
jgi:hypothetical protein